MIRAGALIAVSHSGGKDSLYLREMAHALRRSPSGSGIRFGDGMVSGSRADAGVDERRKPWRRERLN